MTTYEARDRTQKAAAQPLASSTSTKLDKKVLANLVLEAVKRVGENELAPPISPQAGLAYQPRAILAMLTYCYANGVCGSADVEQTMYEDTAFRALFGLDFPDARRLRKFRRHNHAVLKRTLEETLRGARSLHPGPGSPATEIATKTNNGLANPAVPDGIAEEAERQIEKAMFIDQMTLE